MRNLEECKAEVFRRSEERIKKRKKNVLALGSTFVICFMACFMIEKSGLLNMGQETAEQDNQLMDIEDIQNPNSMEDSSNASNQDNILDSDDTTNQEAQESTECPYVQAEIVKAYWTPQMESYLVTDETKVAELYEVIQSIFNNEEGVLREEIQDDFESILYQNENQNDAEEGIYELSSGGLLRNTDYAISFKIQVGKYHTYALKSNVLLDFTKEKALILTEKELSDLKAAMGVDE